MKKTILLVKFSSSLTNSIIVFYNCYVLNGLCLAGACAKNNTVKYGAFILNALIIGTGEAKPGSKSENVAEITFEYSFFFC